MDMNSLLLVAGTGILLGMVAQILFRKKGLPEALLLMLFGAGVSAFGFAGDIKSMGDAVLLLVTLSLIYVTFVGSMPINLKALLSTAKYSFLSAITNFIIVTLVVGGACYLIGLDWIKSLLVGALFSALDGTTINSLLDTMRTSKKFEAQIQHESAITDIFIIVFVLTVLRFSSIQVGMIAQGVLAFLFFSFGLGVVAAVFWSYMLRHMEDTLATIMSTMGVLILLYLFAELAGANGAVTLFFFAIILSNITLLGKMMYKKEKSRLTMLNQETKDFFRAISFILRTFLFIYLGILADLSQWPFLLLGAALFAAAYLLRSFIRGFVHNREVSGKEQCLSDAMCVKGFTPAVLLPLIPGLGPFSNVVIGGIFSSIIISSIMIHLIQKDRFSSANEVLRGIRRK